MTEQAIITLIQELSAVIVALGLLTILTFLTIILIKEAKKQEEKRIKYLNTLTDEEKATIGKYIANTK